MLQSVLTQIKNLKPSEIVQDLKNKAQENIEHLQAEAFFKKAGEVVSHAVALTEEEIHKGVQTLVRKALEGRIDVTEAEKIEIACILSEFEKTPKGFGEYVKARTGFVLSNIPKTFDEVKNLKSTIVDALVAEARQSLKDSGLEADADGGQTNRIIPKSKKEASTSTQSDEVEEKQHVHAAPAHKKKDDVNAAAATDSPKATPKAGGKDPRKKGYPEKPKTKAHQNNDSEDETEA